jgi:hypothetical protein
VRGNRVKGGGPASPSLAWANFSIMIECMPESGRCHSVCTLWCKHSQPQQPGPKIPSPLNHTRKKGKLLSVYSVEINGVTWPDCRKAFTVNTCLGIQHAPHITTFDWVTAFTLPGKGWWAVLLKRHRDWNRRYRNFLISETGTVTCYVICYAFCAKLANHFLGHLFFLSHAQFNFFMIILSL